MLDAGVLNILSTPVIDGLRRVLAQLRDDDTVRVLVLRGASDRAFVAGADIAEMAGLDEQRARRFISNLRDLCNAVRHFPVPVIARIPAGAWAAAWNSPWPAICGSAPITRSSACPK